MSVRYRYGIGILRVGISIIPIPYRYRKCLKVDTVWDTEKIRYRYFEIEIGMGSVWDQYSVAYAHP
ncbi:hypothetical protein Hanom_Chr07g00583101 [Helianthus anomalus]